MSDPACTFIKPEDTPCAAHPLPGRPFCLFHDPEQKECLAQARRKGGGCSEDMRPCYHRVDLRG